MIKWLARREKLIYLTFGIALLIAVLLLMGCSSAPVRPAGTRQVSPKASAKSEAETAVEPDAGDAETGDRTGPGSSARAGRDLRQQVKDLSTQVTSLEKSVTQNTEVTNKQLTKLRQETTTIQRQMKSSLETDLGQMAEKVGNIGELVQKTQSTVQNYGISKKRLTLEKQRNRRQWRCGEMGGFALFGLVLVALAADGPKGWRGKLAFYALGGLFMLSAVGMFFGLG